MSKYAVIMAGGPRTRLWPMSRKSRPKQLLPFGPEGRSLLRTSLERLTGTFDGEHIYVIAGADHLEAIRTELPELPEANLIGEPVPRDTANAIALACAVISQRDPQGTIAVVTADHIIEPVDRFQKVIETAMARVERHPDYLGTFGIKPTWAHPGLGYIHRGPKLDDGDVPTFEVRAFKEKPDPATAQRYLADGEHYWNSGMFVWKAKTIMDQLHRHLPQNTERLVDLARSFGRPEWPIKAAEVYEPLDKISIDYAVMEKAQKVLVVEMDCRWADVGSWVELRNVTGTDGFGTAALANKLVPIDSNDNVVVSSDDDHLIATIGVRDVIVVHTPDATLICAKDQAQKIKDLVKKLELDFETHT